jgi:hypothetical protein
MEHRLGSVVASEIALSLASLRLPDSLRTIGTGPVGGSVQSPFDVRVSESPEHLQVTNTYRQQLPSPGELPKETRITAFIMET